MFHCHECGAHLPQNCNCASERERQASILFTRNKINDLREELLNWQNMLKLLEG